jgi:tripartite-type tricarboxylate transporter receptor subunit TctC
MREALGGATIVIENAPGASGTIGIGKFARSAPDGYTLGLGNWGTFVLNSAVFTLPYDTVTDFEPVATVATDAQVIISRPDLPANTLAELIAWLKANPGKGTQGTGGTGSSSHVIGVLFQRMTNTQFAFVPYRQGVGAAMADLMAGRLDTMFSVAANAIPYVKSGQVKAYAVTSKERMRELPDLPTVHEAGLPGFQAINWHGVFAPKGTPRPIIDRLNAALVATLADAKVRKRLEDVGQDIPPREQQSPAALARLLQSDRAAWGPVIRDAGIKSE